MNVKPASPALGGARAHLLAPKWRQKPVPKAPGRARKAGNRQSGVELVGHMGNIGLGVRKRYYLRGTVMKELSFDELLDKCAPASTLTDFIIHELSVFNLGKTVDFNFLTRPSIGAYCRSLGFAPSRNWSMLTLDKIAPKSALGPNVVPEREAKAVLSQLRHSIDTRLLQPKNKGKPQPDIISDFLSKGKPYKCAKTLGHLWEFQYALAVELEHGKTRGSNVTNNHPLLTALVVVAHLTEDKLYYARLWEMETSAELFNAHLEKAPTRPIMKENMHAKTYLQQRLQERVKNV